MAKTSAAQLRAVKKYNQTHKAQKRIYNYRSYTRKFIREMANQTDINEIKNLVKIREAELNN